MCGRPQEPEEKELVDGDNESDDDNEEEYREGTLDLNNLLPIGMEHQWCATRTPQLSHQGGLRKVAGPHSGWRCAEHRQGRNNWAQFYQ